MTAQQRSRLLSLVAGMAAVAAVAVGGLKLMGDGPSDSTAAGQSPVTVAGADGARAGADGADLSATSSSVVLNASDDGMRGPLDTLVISSDGEAVVPGGMGAMGGSADRDSPSASALAGAAPGPASPSTRTPGSTVNLPLTSAEASAATAGSGSTSPAASNPSAPPANAAATATTRPGSSTAMTAAPTSAIAPAAKVTPTTAKPTTVPPTTRPTTASTMAAPAAPAAGLSGVEQEIVRMTNELRTNPNGPLARKGAVPSCKLTLDSSGKPAPVPALAVNAAVSAQMSRDWSQQMDSAFAMSHRPNASAQAVYSQLGIKVSAYGENVAWFQGYSDAQAAKVFFEGWRESDGHYCNMMSPMYTTFGVGVFKGSVRTWATQNFYQAR